MDKKTGEERWSYDIRKDGDQKEFHGDPLVSEKLIITTTDGNMGHVYAFDQRSGEVRWRYRVAWRGLASDVVRSGNNVYVVTLEDKLVCLDLESGAARWTFPSSAPPKLYYWTSSPAMLGDRVYFGGLDGFMYAVEASSGKVAWKSNLGARISTSVITRGYDIYLGTADHHLYRLDADSGRVLGEMSVEAEPRWRIVPGGDSLLVFLGPQILASVDFSLKQVRWSAKASQQWMSARPYVWHDLVLAGGRDELVAIRASDGARVWSHQISGTVRGIGVTDNVLYVGTLEGPVFAFAYR